MAFCMPSELVGLLECLEVSKLPLQWTFVRRTGEYRLIMSWKYTNKKSIVAKGKKKTWKMPNKRNSEEKLLTSPKIASFEESDEDEQSDEETLASSGSPGGQDTQPVSPEANGQDNVRQDSFDDKDEVASECTLPYIADSATSSASKKDKKKTKVKNVSAINLKDKEVFRTWYKKTAGRKK